MSKRKKRLKISVLDCLTSSWWCL